MSGLNRREIPILIASTSAALALIEYFVRAPELGLTAIVQMLLDMATNVMAFVTIYGALFVIIPGVRRVLRRESEWYLGGWRIICFLIMFSFGLIPPMALHPVFNWIYLYVFFPIINTIFAFMGFYILSAAFRAFRARSGEAAALLIAGCITLLANTPAGAAMYEGIPILGAWLMDYPTAAAMRGIAISVGIGAVILGIRVILGREREAMGLE